MVFALPDALFASTPTVFRVAHVLFGLLYLSACIPVYLLARGAGLERWQAMFPAAAAILTPWMLFGGTMLNVTLAYPTAMALAWSTWKTAVQPSLRADATVLVFGVLAAMAREAQALFLVGVAFVVLVAAWRDVPDGTMRAKARRYPRHIVGAHPLLFGAAGGLLVLVAVYGTHSLVGTAYQPVSTGPPVTLSATLTAIGTALAELTMGTGYLPMIIGLPWLARELVRPRARATGTLALVTVGFFAAFMVTVVYFDTTTGAEGANERYICVLAGLPPLIAALALFRREVAPWAVAISGLLLTRLVVTDGLYTATGPYSYFVAPARLFFTSVMQGQLSTRLPFNDNHVATTLLLVMVAIAVALAYLATQGPRLEGRGALAATSIALGAPIALGAGGGIWDGNKFETLATSPAVSFEQLAFVDAATRSKPAALWEYAPAAEPGAYVEAEQARFFNRSLRGTVRLSGMPAIGDAGRDNIVAAVDDETGALRTTAPLTTYLLVPVRFTQVGLAGTFVAGPSGILGQFPLVLERIDRVPRLAYAVIGTDAEGWIPAASPSATIRVFASSDPTCWRTGVAAPPVVPRPIQYAIDGPGLHRSGELGPGESAPIYLHSPAAGSLTVRIDVRGGGTAAGGAPVAAGISAFAREACQVGRS
jgi:hypothetical protein